MNDSEELSQAQIAELLGVNRHMLSKAAPYLPDFPIARQVGGRRRRYQRAEILAWAEGRDVKALVSAGGSQARAGGLDDKAAAFNTRCREFISGAFVSQAQQQQNKLKRLISRQCHRPGQRRAYAIVPDWAQDQRGTEIPQTKIIERTK
ncbi:MAG: hypothetical protein BVN35_09460 [Proteobacteria bacterium ST_bin11]|nr:MAG: hypothetical protein BVN35_09460 [Proteobacteria bacterium ST_bin11]